MRPPSPGVKPPDDGLHCVEVSDLPPIRRAPPGPVRTPNTLCHHSLEIALDDDTPQGVPIIDRIHGDERFGQPKRLESVSTLLDRCLDQRALVKVEQVERHE